MNFDQTIEYRFCPKCGEGLALRRLKDHEPERLVCQSCEFVFFLNPKVAAGTVFQHEGRLVLLRRAIEPAYGKWVFPGGFVDRGETVIAGAVRETKEEANVDVEVRALLDVFSYPNSPVVVIAYAAEIVLGTPEAKDEALELRGFDPRDIPWEDLAFPSTTDALRIYIDRHLK